MERLRSTYDLPRFYVQPEFSYLIHECRTPFYAQSAPIINRKLTEYPKSVTPDVQYKSLYVELKSNEYRNYKKIYTDGSKSANGVGSAAVTATTSCPATLPKEASIFTAEVHALKMAVDSIQRTGSTENVIFTDSRSAIEALHSKSHHPVILYIHHQLHKFQLNNIKVEL